ncbi:hypothetical protein L1049_023815 [Liquidambar formosana]|uniref:X8 domain-containing protein n=1 Tax=Liquidambar formosana TaxID=63359 RepID=A0AAP0RV36_LIQFO
MATNFSFSLLLSLILSLPFTHGSLHRRTDLGVQSKAQNGVVTLELWCVAKNNAEDAALQSSLDWACGPGGADCTAIQQGGPCYDAADIQRTASFAFNNYFLKHGLTEDSCYFDNSAALTSLNPSFGNCKFPSSFTVNNASLSGSSSTVGLGPASADLSGCNQIGNGWGLALLVALHLFFTITWLL